MNGDDSLTGYGFHFLLAKRAILTLISDSEAPNVFDLRHVFCIELARFIGARSMEKRDERNPKTSGTICRSVRGVGFRCKQLVELLNREEFFLLGSFLLPSKVENPLPRIRRNHLIVLGEIHDGLDRPKIVLSGFWSYELPPIPLGEFDAPRQFLPGIKLRGIGRQR